MIMLRKYGFTSLLCCLFVVLPLIGCVPIEPCHDRQACQNGGTCHRVLRTVANDWCTPEHNYIAYNGRCYQLLLTNANWDEANRHCLANGAKLVKIDNQYTREFVQQLLTSKLQKDSVFSDLSVWTGGRSVGARNAVTWVWKPFGQFIDNKYWAPAQPNPMIDFKDSCMVLSSTNQFNLWSTQHCTDSRAYYICEDIPHPPANDLCCKETGANEPSGQYHYECECPKGYNGYFCEIAPDLMIPPPTTELLACSSQRFYQSCKVDIPGQDQVIVVDMVLYGMFSLPAPPRQCGINQAPSEVDCVSPNALALIRQRCQGRAVCDLEPLSTLFPVNGCRPGTPNYMRYRVRCLPAAQMQCSQGIRVLDRCYQLQTQPKSWLNAQRDCMGRGGDLLGPISFGKQYEQLMRAISTPGVPSYWLGLRNGRDGFQWVDGSRLRFTAPGSNLTSFNVSNVSLFRAQGGAAFAPPCVAHRPLTDGSGIAAWMNTDCYRQLPYVCEYAMMEKSNEELPSLIDQFTPRPTTVRTLPPELPTKRTTLTDTTPSTPHRRVPLEIEVETEVKMRPADYSDRGAPSPPTRPNRPVTPAKPTISPFRPITDPVTVTQTVPQFITFGSPEPPVTTRTEAPTQPTTLETPSSTSAVFEQSSAECASVRVRGVMWPRARSDTRFNTVYEPCPQGTTGTAQWTCQVAEDGLSSSYQPLSGPDLSACTSVWMQQLNAQLPSMNEIDAAEQLVRGLGQGDNLVGGDVKGALQVMQSLLREFSADLQYPQAQYPAVKDFTSLMGAASSELLAPSHNSAWNDLPRAQRTKSVSDLIGSMDASAQLLARSLAAQGSTQAQAISEQYDNMAVQVQVVSTRPQVQEPVQPPHNDAHNSNPNDITIMVGNPAVPGPPATESNGNRQEISNSKSHVTFEDKNAGYSASMVLPDTNTLFQAFMNSAGRGPSFKPAGPSDDPLRENTVRVSFVTFRNMTELMSPSMDGSGQQSIVNGQVVSATVNSAKHAQINLPPDQPVTLAFNHLRTIGVNQSSAKCVWWHTSKNEWSTTGCELVQSLSNGSMSTCACTHLTSFTILMDITDYSTRIHATERLVLNAITKIGCAVSCGCLIVCVLVFTLIKQLWSIRTTIHRNLCFSLLVAELLFLFGIEATKNARVCTGVAMAMHYSFLCAFMWMLIEGYQLYVMLIQVFDNDNTVRKYVYYVLAYGLPAIVVGVSGFLWTDDYGTQDYCWTRTQSYAMWAFVAPVALVVIINFTFLLVAFRVVLSVRVKRNQSERVLGWLKGASMLLCLLGLTWAFGFGLLFADRTLTSVFAYTFTVLNCLQGVFIFVLHVLLNEQVRTALARCARSCCVCCVSRTQSSTFNSSDNSAQKLRKGSDEKQWSGDNDGFHSQSTNSTDTANVSSIYALPEWPIESEDNEENHRRESKLMQHFNNDSQHLYQTLTPPSVMFNRDRHPQYASQF